MALQWPGCAGDGFAESRGRYATALVRGRANSRRRSRSSTSSARKSSTHNHDGVLFPQQDGADAAVGDEAYVLGMTPGSRPRRVRSIMDTAADWSALATTAWRTRSDDSEWIRRRIGGDRLQHALARLLLQPREVARQAGQLVLGEAAREVLEIGVRQLEQRVAGAAVDGGEAHDGQLVFEGQQALQRRRGSADRAAVRR